VQIQGLDLCSQPVYFPSLDLQEHFSWSRPCHIARNTIIRIYRTARHFLSCRAIYSTFITSHLLCNPEIHTRTHAGLSFIRSFGPNQPSSSVVLLSIPIESICLPTTLTHFSSPQYHTISLPIQPAMTILEYYYLSRMCYTRLSYNILLSE
jgi:hypothetical protein